MPLLHIDTQLDLFCPSICSSGRDFVYITYLSHVKINGDVFPLSIALPVENAETQPLATGTVAHVSGSLSVVGNSLLVTASEIVPLYVASTPQTRAGIAKLYEPFVTAMGFVSSGRVHDLRNPAALVVDLTVERQDRWPHTPTTVRCYFNRDERRFHTLIPMVRGTPLLVAGALIGWEDGMLALDIHEVRCNNNGVPPEFPLAVYPNPFQGRPMTNGYAVFDGPTSPPAYTLEEKVSSKGSDSEGTAIVADAASGNATCKSPVSPGGTLLAKRALTERVVSPGPRPSKVARTSALRERAD